MEEYKFMSQPMMKFSKRKISFICFHFSILVYNNIQKNYREKKRIIYHLKRGKGREQTGGAGEERVLNKSK